MRNGARAPLPTHRPVPPGQYPHLQRGVALEAGSLQALRPHVLPIVKIVGGSAAAVQSSPWENGYVESFNARLRDELLNGEIFYTLREAQIVIESWRRHYNTIRPHASLG